MILFPVLKYWSWFSIFLLMEIIFAQGATKAGGFEEPKAPRKKVYIGGSISVPLRKACYSSINRERKIPVEEVTELQESEYAIFYEKLSQGYLVRLERRGRVIQTARALLEYELPLAAAALARDHIPED
ncbi:MAG: hypothetical protein RML34_04700 [Leptospiraceae bacterium]|nr:hypothetical protein [Leptospiraceae bacterium]